jgi:excisionase family DNA binding protein
VIKVLTIAEAAHAASITRRHLENMLAKGEGPVTVSLGKRRLITESDFDKWITSRREKPRTKASKPIATHEPVIPTEVSSPA